MTKVIGMLVALAMFCAIPSIAFAGTSLSEGDDVVGGDIVQDGTTGGSGGSSTGEGDGGDGGSGGDVNQQAATCTQDAGDDANCEIDQSINGGGGGDDDGVSGDDDGGDSDNVTSGGVGGGVEGVTLAQTGFDAWVLALVGGLALAGGLGLLVAQRRGRIGA